MSNWVDLYLMIAITLGDSSSNNFIITWCGMTVGLIAKKKKMTNEQRVIQFIVFYLANQF